MGFCGIATTNLLTCDLYTSSDYLGEVLDTLKHNIDLNHPGDDGSPTKHNISCNRSSSSALPQSAHKTLQFDWFREHWNSEVCEAVDTADLIVGAGQKELL